MSDITDRIAEVIMSHCVCDCSYPEGLPRCDHIAAAVADLLIDLAGTGQLLASIDQIAREPDER